MADNQALLNILSQAEAMNKNIGSMKLPDVKTGSTLKDFLLNSLMTIPMGVGAKVPTGMMKPEPPPMSSNALKLRASMVDKRPNINKNPNLETPANDPISPDVIGYNNALENQAVNKLLDYSKKSQFKVLDPPNPVAEIPKDVNLTSPSSLNNPLDTKPGRANFNPPSARIYPQDVKDIVRQMGLTIKDMKPKGKDQTVYMKVTDPDNPRLPIQEIRIPSDKKAHRGYVYPTDKSFGKQIDLGTSGTGNPHAFTAKGEPIGGNWQTFIDTLRWKHLKDPTGGNFLTPYGTAPRSAFTNPKDYIKPPQGDLFKSRLIPEKVTPEVKPITPDPKQLSMDKSFEVARQIN